MPNQDSSTDPKTSSSGGGFRNLFTKLFSRNPKEHDGSSQDTSTSGERRSYVPRHATRDMLLAIPVEQRPDVTAKADETRRESAMAEMGFSTARHSMQGQRMQRENASPRRHSLASSSSANSSHRLSFARSSSQRQVTQAVGLGTMPRQTRLADAGTNPKRIEDLNSASPDVGWPQTGPGDGPERNGVPSGGISRQNSTSRRTTYFTHSAGRGQNINKGKGRATEEEVQAAMLRDRARASTMRNPGMSHAGPNPAPTPVTPTHSIASKTFGRWPRAKAPASGIAGQPLEQLKEEHQPSRPISSIDGSVSTSHADSMRSFTDTEASTAATTITDQHSERGLDRSESEEEKTPQL